MAIKDRTTIHATAYFDDARLVPDLRSDIAEEPNRIFVTGQTPGGRRIKNGHYPGLVQGKPPPARHTSLPPRTLELLKTMKRYANEIHKRTLPSFAHRSSFNVLLYCPRRWWAGRRKSY
jgi:hypothetical protein